ncbi:molybdopterin oxidoreductase family protein [Nesterenkonia halophila]|uniref:molybdopterin oxidoreductase family protein n=1 Tax=Nesterenkonia halophila TaxID=302044 RepID=UPI00129175A1|nr:molybdopterin oxidoreductase family protein [Nesterenkonia halophila]
MTETTPTTPAGPDPGPSSEAPQTRSVQTHCPYCALQCAMTLTVTSRPDAGDDYAVAGAEFPTNRGRLCRKGATAADLLTRGDRLTAPLLRDADGELRETDWDSALAHVASRVAALQDAHGRDAVGVFGSGALTNEKAYALGTFARTVLGTAQIDYNGRFCMSSASKASTLAFGLDRGMPFPLTDLDGAATILLLGSNVADTMPPFVQHLQGAREKGGLIVVDPRRSNTAALTEGEAGFHIAPSPGGDLVLLLAVAQVILDEGFAAEDYLAERVDGLAAFRRAAMRWWPEQSQTVTGVGADMIRQLARRLGHAAARARAGGDPVFILTGRGVEQHRDGTDTARAAISLALLLGLPGTDAGGYGTLTGQGNGQGGREMGQKNDQLPGARSILDPTDRAHMAEVWGVDEAAIPGVGRSAAQLLHTMGTGDGVRGLLVHGSNVAISAPDADRVLENLRELDLLVVADFFLSETAAEADVVLPVLQWAEEEGTMTSLEGRVLRRRRAVEPPAGPRSELEILAELARRLGSQVDVPTEPAAVFAEIGRATRGATADYSGLDYAALDDGQAAYWPLPAEPASSTARTAASVGAEEAGERTTTDEPIAGTARMFRERFAHPDGRARLTDIRAGRGVAPAGRQLVFTTGRLMEHYQSGAQTRRVQELHAAHPAPTLQLHPAVAAQFGLAEGEPATVTSDQGEMTGLVVLDYRLRTDTVFAPFHFSGAGTANRITRGLTDPQSKMPEFKNTPVSIRPAETRDPLAVATTEEMPR